MRYVKADFDGVTEYRGPGMGDSWFAANGWLKYEGSLPAERLAVECGRVIELPKPEVTPEPRVISKLKLRDALEATGAWQQLRQALEAAGEYERWLYAHDVSENAPGFAAITAQLAPALAANGIDLNELLNQCIMERW